MRRFFAAIRKKITRKKEYTSIHPSILFHIAWKNFTSKKLRSFLTVFGVVIGVSAVFFLLSFGLGIQGLVTTQVVGDKSLKSIDVTSPNSKIIKLNTTAINAIRTYPHVEKVGVQYTFPGIASLSGGEIDAVVYGVDQTYQELSSLLTASGRLLKNEDAKSVVLNISALKALGVDDAGSAIGKEVKINVPLDKAEAKDKSIAASFTVVGVIDSGTGSEMYIPSTLFDTAGVPSYGQVKVVVDDLANVDAARKQIEANGFQTTSLTDTLTEINNIFKFFNLTLVGFGSIGMIVAVLGMFNTLTISLLERTREIGLMMALGARRRDMRILFILEAALISVVGAVIGIVIAFVAGQIVNLLINLNAQSRGVTEWFNLFSTPLWSVLAVIGITVLVGLVVVYLPARRAERINPIDALRRE
jgi:putative ABC transport system permease protein